MSKRSQEGNGAVCPLCAGLGMTLYHGAGETAEVRFCSACGTGLPIAPSEVPNVTVQEEADD